MNNFKPKVSSESRALQTYSRYSRRQQQDSEPKGKKALGKDIGKLTEIFNMPLDVFFEVSVLVNLLPVAWPESLITGVSSRSRLI